MGHSRTAALLAAEWLFHFADFGALQVANFQRNAFERSRHDSERGKILRVAIALDHLRSDRGRGQAKFLADFLLDLRAEMSTGSHRAGNFSNRHLLRCALEARKVSAIFRVPISHFKTKGDGLGVNAMRAPNLRRVFEFPRAALENLAKSFQVFFD